MYQLAECGLQPSLQPDQLWVPRPAPRGASAQLSGGGLGSLHRWAVTGSAVQHIVLPFPPSNAYSVPFKSAPMKSICRGLTVDFAGGDEVSVDGLGAGSHQTTLLKFLSEGTDNGPEYGLLGTGHYFLLYTLPSAAVATVEMVESKDLTGCLSFVFSAPRYGHPIPMACLSPQPGRPPVKNYVP